MKAKPKAFLFARMEDDDTDVSAAELQNRVDIMKLNCGEDYEIIKAIYFLTKIFTFEKDTLPAMIYTRQNNLIEPFTLIVCYWHELAAADRKAFIKQELEKLNVKVKVLYY